MRTELQKAIPDVLSSPRRCTAFYALSVLIFLLLMLIPVWSTPGNDLLFQLEITEGPVMLLMILLSLGNALLLVMQYHVRHAGNFGGVAERTKEGVTFVGIFTSSLTATVACAACYSSFLSILGLGGAAFVVEYRLWFSLLAILITAYALHHSSRKVNHGCEVCQVKL